MALDSQFTIPKQPIKKAAPADKSALARAASQKEYAQKNRQPGFRKIEAFKQLQKGK